MKLYKPTKVTYVPHGIDPYIYRPIKEDDPGFLKFQKDLTISKEDYDFIVLYNNRNIRRKMPNDLLVAFKLMTNKLNKQQKDRTLLIYHTEPIDNHGTDLYASHQALCNECNVKFSTNKLSTTQLNYLYNLADCTGGVSSAEGFGLATAESLMAGTPILINSIGGLQDQAGFVDEEGNEIEYSSDFPSNSCKRYTKHGKWAFVVWPQSNIVGSPPTPYIYDSRASINDISKQLYKMYLLGRQELQKRGLRGREFVINKLSSNIMCGRIIHDIEQCLQTFAPQKRFNIYKAVHDKKNNNQSVGIWDKENNKWI